ncbi:MAG TPA: hypothetical protein DEP79_05075 [Gammaproteobacteria bacterium]|nr:hypothetical protein [Gammaproteobacteria bacterium]
MSADTTAMTHAITLHIAIAAKGDTSLESVLTTLTDALLLHTPDVALHLHIAQDSHTAPQEYESIALELIPLPVRTHPGFSMAFSHCPPGTSILRLWGTALAQNCSQYVAVLDACCPPSGHWLEHAIAGIRKGEPLFYGAVEPAWPLTDIRITGYLIEYAQFKFPIECDSEYPGNNIVFQARFLPPAQELEQKGFFKTFMVWNIQQQHNISPTFVDNMEVLYAKGFNIPHYFKRRKSHGQCFGGCRHQQDNQPPRWACILFTPALFLVRTARIYNWIKHKPDLKKAFFRFLPLIIGSELAWSYGEFVGYSVGAGNSCQQLD